MPILLREFEMKLVCAWCGVPTERTGYSDRTGLDTSHGMCTACAQALAHQERGAPLQEYLNGIHIPILLIDHNNAAVTMNAKACDTFATKLDGTETQFLGRVYDCLHSRSAEGCGRKIHCSGCAIRRSVTATFNTGEPQNLVLATLNITSPDQPSAAVLAVSTVLLGGLVLLHLE